MNLQDFAQRSVIVNKTELEKVLFLAYFYYQTEEKQEFSIPDISQWFSSLNFSQPNMSRLNTKLMKSKWFIKGNRKGLFRIQGKYLGDLQKSLSWVNEESEEIIFTGAILPESVFINTRGYIELIAKQINSSYEKNIFDGCAVLMRRLVEILLIHIYRKNNLEDLITNPEGQYKDLSVIIKDVKQNQKIGLSKGTKDCLDIFRLLGNFSAHKIEYNCRRDDIKKIAFEYRASIEELLYKAGIRT
jgi:hypothetical protein